jgi:RNA polymerase sigma-70 factor, ECF subfamily
MESNVEREKYIITEVQNGNFELFGELIHIYQSPLFIFINRIIHNNDDAMDITQETLFKAYRSIKSFKYKSKFSTWLFQIGYNESINLIRKHARHCEIEKSIAVKINNDYHTAEIENTELSEEIEKSLHELKQEQRLALHLLYKEEKSYKEIADIMEIPVNTVKSHIRRGKDLLKQRLSLSYDPETILT